MKRSFLFSGVFFLLISFAFASNFRIDPNTQHFIDEFGRARIFHGVNAVYKLFPHHPPILDSFDAFNSLSDTDFQNLRSWGLSLVRLYLSWEGTERVRGQYNTTYLEIVRGIVRKAAKYNITIILDAHQDIASRKLCGEGLPDWAVNRTDFPAPLPGHISYDEHGYANITDCNKKEFALYYTTNDVRNTFKNFYNNVDGVADSFTNFWRAVADFFKNEPNVLAYELINEPPSFTVEKVDIDLNYLQPLYKKTHDKIRQVDNNTIIFFEPQIFDIVSVGFTEGPGGPEYNDRQALSYHIYCPDVTPTGEPITPMICQTLDSQMLKVKAEKAKKLGVPGILTEFGALSATPKSCDEISRVTQLADEYLHSWTYWQFKWYDDFTTAARPGSTESFYFPDGSLQEPKVKALARSYAVATCGVPTAQRFEPGSGEYTFSFRYKKDCKGKSSEFFFHEKFYYPDGIKYVINQCEGCTLVGSNNYYSIQTTDSTKDNALITLRVSNGKFGGIESISI